jgi:hypothetical protein
MIFHETGLFFFLSTFYVFFCNIVLYICLGNYIYLYIYVYEDIFIKTKT